jgi:glycosyltransferase involved in cell wall biosynthesis
MDGPPLRVLFLTPYFRPYLGGIERAIEQLSFQIQKSPEVEALGVLTTKYCFPRVPQQHWADRETTPEGIAIYRLSGYPKRSIPLYSVPLVWFSPLRVRSYLREFNPNVIHFVGDGWFWGHFWAWFWFHGRARFVFTPSFHPLPLSSWWLRPINGFICNVVDRVIALTRMEADLVRRAYWIAGRKQGIIGWGATPPELPRLSSGENKVPDSSSPLGARGDSQRKDDSVPLIILCVGRLGRHKGQAWLLNVYQQAKSQFNRPTRLVLVGRYEDDEASIVDEVRTRGLDGEVLLAGGVSDGELAEWYARSDLFVLFSQYEAFGLVFFEAMAHGVPVLTHDVGANRELLVRGAEVVPRFDIRAAVQGLARLVNDTGYRAQLGQEAQEYALAEFTWSAVAEKYLREYSKPGSASHGPK